MENVRRAAAEAAADTQTRQHPNVNRQRSGSGSFQSFSPENFNNSGPTTSTTIPTPNLRSQITEAPKRVDREKVCPLLLRVFIKFGRHHNVQEFDRRGREPRDEVQIHTWKDASLRELAELVKDVDRTAREPNALLSFAFVYPDPRGRSVMREVGLVHSTKGSEDDHKTLEELSFQTGDFLDVAVML